MARRGGAAPRAGRRCGEGARPHDRASTSATRRVPSGRGRIALSTGVRGHGSISSRRGLGHSVSSARSTVRGHSRSSAQFSTVRASASAVDAITLVRSEGGAAMKLVILGGGGFRVPLVHGALLRDTADRRVTEVVLHDTDRARLDVMRHGPVRTGRRPRERPGRAPHGHRDDRPRHGARRGRLRLLGDAGRRSRGTHRRRADRARPRAARPGDDRPRWRRLRPAHRPRRARRRPTHTPSGPRRVGHQLHQPGRPRHPGDAVGAR